MTDAHDQAFTAAEKAAGSGSAHMLAMVLDKLGASAGARAVFGKPVERDGRTVIPVAQAIIGTGGGSGSSGSGSDPGARGSGEGAGGGALTRPIGYIEITPHGTAFVPLKQPWQDPGLVLAYSLLALVVLRAAVRLIRG